MSIKCPICGSIYITAINNALKNKEKSGRSFRDIAGEFPYFTERQIQNHFYQHMLQENAVIAGKPDNVLRETSQETLQEAEILQEDISDLQRIESAESEAWKVYTENISSDVVVALKALGAATELMKLRFKLLDENRVKESAVDLETSPEWISLRTKILQILSRHPLALEDLREVLGGANNGQI